ncbi:hypothetical protein GGP84_002310 [Salinibacter ruber]|uniref:DUF4019 domain-containing protein n=1 Tax=Salinibacter ruber TaxID=146919 RepID=UPI002166C18F|nr:DUF4019 domain-containing protein [Salinibacter ruber]MCS3939677.1 hypothetical protein [Salinibacter ruber]
MRSSLFIGGLLALFLIAPRSLPAQSNEQAVEAAKEAAQEWFVLLDADKYEATWEEAATFFKSKVTAEQWAAQVRRAHAALDSLRSRSLVAARYTKSVPNAPEGEYVVAQYRSMYGEKETVETTYLKKDDGTWRVAGYYVKPGGQ